MAEFSFSIKEKADTEEHISQRPKMPKKFTFFALLFILVIITPVILNKFYNYELAAVDPNSKNITKLFVVTPGEPLVTIAQDLKKENLIKNAFAFHLLVAQMGISKSVQAGDFRLSAAMNAKEIASQLTHGAIDVWITFPEGTRVEEMADIIDKKLNSSQNQKYGFDKKEFISQASEGNMFPDTYLVAKDAATKDIATRLRTTFDEKVDRKILLKGIGNNLTEQEVVILASIIEREAKSDEERPIIAGILLNRLNAQIALQVDATVQYSKGYDSSKNSWWPQVTQEDYTSVKSQYNTYLHSGLPPKPICNPGLESIKAAAEPAKTDYLFYLHDSKGKIHYAKTNQEHEGNKKEFL